MKIIKTHIDGLFGIELKVFRDERGLFTERYHSEKFKELGITENFVQDNYSRSSPGVLRGLHMQLDPPQGKLVGVTRGKIWDLAVDLRPGSKTYGQHSALELSDENAILFWIPAGFAHGFYVLGNEPADVMYKVTGHYNPKTEKGFRWNDPKLNIRWPDTNPQVSARDAALPYLE